MLRDEGKKAESYELLKKYGARWAVLAAFHIDLRKRGVNIDTEITSELETAHVIIRSGCFSTCEASCSLGKIEAGLIPLGSKFGDDYIEEWFNLLEQAMQGKIDINKISNIPLLQPIKTDCGFLECVC